jgi:hypothetical protein
MQMVRRRIPESIKGRLRRRLEERVGGRGRYGMVGSLGERLRGRLRERLLEKKGGSIEDRIRGRLRERLLEKKGGSIEDRIRGRLRRRSLSENFLEAGNSIEDRIRGRLRRRSLLEEEVGDSREDRIKARVRERLLEEYGSGLRHRIGERLLKRGNDLEEVLRRGIRRRLMERRLGSNRVGALRLRRRLDEAVDENGVRGQIRERIRGRIRERILEGREVMKSVGGKPMLKVMTNEVGLRGRGVERLGHSSLRERLGRLPDEGSVSERSKVVEAFLRRKVQRLEGEVERLERELRRKTKLLKEAYKVVKRVEGLGGVDKVEEAMRLAHDTIVKAGSRLFKGAVEELARETGVNKKEVATVVKKVGLKEAREILKGGKRSKAEAKTVIVEGMGVKDEQVPVLAARMAERLSKQVEVGNPGDMNDLGKAIFTKGV